MTKDDIMLALRLTAMGRAGHPLQEQLADELVKVFAERVEVLAEELIQIEHTGPAEGMASFLAKPAVKRTRKPKAD